jgi:hypothetical protein
VGGLGRNGFCYCAKSFVYCAIFSRIVASGEYLPIKLEKGADAVRQENEGL